MSAPWIKVEHSLPTKPEVVAIASRLELDEDAVVGKLIRLWVWADIHTFDGRPNSGRTPVHSGYVDRLTGVNGFAEALRQVGWLEIDSAGGISFPNFDRHNCESAKARAESNRRVAKHRARKQAEDSPAAVQSPEHSTSSPGSFTERPQLCNGKSVTESLPDKIREHEIREEKGDSPGGTVLEESDWVGNVPGGWENAEQEFLRVIGKSRWIIQPTKRALPHLYKTRFLELWSDEVWREMLPRAVERLETHPPWHNQKLKLEELLKPETVPFILSGGYDKRAPPARANGDRRHLVNGAHPPDPNQVPRF